MWFYNLKNYINYIYNLKKNKREKKFRILHCCIEKGRKRGEFGKLVECNL